MKIAKSLVFVSLLAVSTARADVSKTEEFNFELNDNGRLSLSNVNGDIRITGVAGNQVHITAKKTADTQKYLDALKIDIDAGADHIRVEAKYPDSNGGWFHWGSNSSGSVDFEVTVPPGTKLDTIETVNGDIDISAVTNLVNVESVNGGLSLSGLANDADMDTVNGEIEALFDVLGAGQRISVDAVNGTVELTLPANASATVRAESLNGDIDADDFGLEADKGYVGQDLDGQIGDGAGRINIDTVNGSITIQKRK